MMSRIKVSTSDLAASSRAEVGSSSSSTIGERQTNSGQQLFSSFLGEQLAALSRPEADILVDGSGKQEGLLHDHSDFAAKLTRLELTVIGASEKDRS
jgi:hypothetical protein